MIEGHRLMRWPQRVSRLRGMFCFLDRRSAELAAVRWGTPSGVHFRQDRLAEIKIAALSEIVSLDSNWITFAPQSTDGHLISPALECWADRYWAGEAYSDKEPIWESIVDGQFIVCGTDLRKLAYELAKGYFPKSLALLEMARFSAWIGYGLGNIAAFLIDSPTHLRIQYAMDFRQAGDPEFLRRVAEERASGTPFNDADMALPSGGMDRTPDLRTYFTSIAKPELAQLGGQPAP